MGAVLEDEACHEDISIGIGRGMSDNGDPIYGINRR
jgi:hypothetical protein